MISFYTCALVLWTAKQDSDYVFTLRRYWGLPGQYVGMCAPSIMVIGALTVYFCVIVQSLYPLLFAFLRNVCGVGGMEYFDPM